MKRLTKEQAIVISAYTGYMVCGFNDMHAEIEKRMGRPVWTHELGREEMAAELRRVFMDDFIAMAPKGKVKRGKK